MLVSNAVDYISFVWNPDPVPSGVNALVTGDTSDLASFCNFILHLLKKNLANLISKIIYALFSDSTRINTYMDEKTRDF